MKENKDNKITFEEIKEIVDSNKIKKKYKNDKKTENEQEDKISLKDLFVFLDKLKKKKISEEAYLVFIDNLEIKRYLPMEEKMKVLLKLIIHLTYTEGFVSELAAIDLEVRKVFLCLLSYTNIDITTVESTPIDFKDYDLLVDSRIYEDIMSVAEKDYHRLENLIDQALKFESMFQVNMNMGNIDYEAMKENLKTAQEFMQGFSSEDLKHLADIATINDPLVTDVAKMVRESKL